MIDHQIQSQTRVCLLLRSAVRPRDKTDSDSSADTSKFGMMSNVKRRKQEWVVISILLILLFMLGLKYVSKPQELSAEQFFELIKARKDHIKRECGRISDTSIHQTKLDRFFSYVLMMESSKIMFCPIYKAASTSWIHNLLLISVRVT